MVSCVHYSNTLISPPVHYGVYECTVSMNVAYIPGNDRMVFTGSNGQTSFRLDYIIYLSLTIPLCSNFILRYSLDWIIHLQLVLSGTKQYYLFMILLVGHRKSG